MPETTECLENTKIKEALEHAKSIAEEYNAYKEIGEAATIKQVLENVKTFTEKYGPLADVAAKLDQLQEFEEGVGELGEVKSFLERMLESATQERAEEISEAFGISVEKARELIEEFKSPAKVSALLLELSESIQPTLEEADGDGDEDDEDDMDDDDLEDEVEEKKDSKTPKKESEDVDAVEGESLDESVAPTASATKDGNDIIEEALEEGLDAIVEEARSPLDTGYLVDAVRRRILG